MTAAVLEGEVLDAVQGGAAVLVRLGGQGVATIDPTSPWRAVFEADCRGKGRSPHTVRAYLRHLEAFFDWSALRSPIEISPALLASWRQELTERHGNSSSMRQAMSALRSLLAFCRAFPAGKHLPDPDTLRHVFKVPKGETRKPYQILSRREISRLVEAARAPRWEIEDESGHNRTWERAKLARSRDVALLMVMLGCGLRVAEVVALEVGDILQGSNDQLRFHIRDGKGGKARTVPVPRDTAAAVLDYLDTTGRQLGNDGAVFQALTGEDGLTVRSVAYVVNRLMRHSAILAKKISPHSLRHTFAVNFLRATGNDVVRLKRYMGHSSLTTTQRYVDHVREEDEGQDMPTVPGAA